MNGTSPQAYSRLGFLLARRNLSVLGLQRKLEAAGVPVNVKSLYRLTEETPLQKIDLRIVAAICQTFDIALGELISFEKPKARLCRLDDKAQSRLEALMSKSNEGRLTAAERKEFATLAGEAHRISMANARTLLLEGKRAGRMVNERRKLRPKRAAALV